MTQTASSRSKLCQKQHLAFACIISTLSILGMASVAVQPHRPLWPLLDLAVALVLVLIGRRQRNKTVIPIAQHVKDITRLRVHKDGDAFFVALDDFVNLQESPAFFIENEYGGHIKATFKRWYGVCDPLTHLTHEELCYLSRQLEERT